MNYLRASRSVHNRVSPHFVEKNMLGSIKMEVTRDAIIKAVRKMSKRERDLFLEDLLAATSPDYLKSIKEARADYKAGRIKSHREVFGD